MQLVDKATRKPLQPGDKRKTFRGETVTFIRAHPPHKAASEGHVTCRDEDGIENYWYASVIGAAYINRNDGRDESADLL